MPLAQIKEFKKRLISLILIFAHNSILFADRLRFKSGEKIEGNLNNYYGKTRPNSVTD